MITDRLEPLVLYESQAHSSESQSSPKEHSTGVAHSVALLASLNCQLESSQPGRGSSTLLEAWLGGKAWATWQPKFSRMGGVLLCITRAEIVDRIEKCKAVKGSGSCPRGIWHFCCPHYKGSRWSSRP